MRAYHGIDGRVPVTGTEWEFEDALQAARERGAPDLLAFRNTSPAPINPLDPQARARSNAQLDALDAFWRRNFADRGVFLAAFDEYSTAGGIRRAAGTVAAGADRTAHQGAAGGRRGSGGDMVRPAVSRPASLRLRTCADLLSAAMRW